MREFDRLNENTISVIVPVYNLENELPRCLDSICAQSHRNLEILVIDDGSRDNSRSVIEEYAQQDPRIKSVFKENGGVTSARLRGVAESTGAWIGFVDGDDEIEPDMYERLLGNAMKYDAQISHCGYQMVFSDGRVNRFHGSGIVKEQSSDTAVRDLLEGTLVEPGLCNKLYHRELFAGLADWIDTDIRINEDLLMNYYLFKFAKKAVFDDWCPYHYIVRGGSASRSKLNEQKIHDPIRVKEIILADASEELRPDAQRALVSTCVYGYSGLICSGEAMARSASKEIRQKLISHGDAIGLLPRRTRLLGQMIVYVPWLYRVIYPLYRKYFQKQKYD